MKPYLYHGIKWYNYDLLLKIIESGYILPRCELTDDIVDDKNNIFNGTKYISLCQKSIGTDCKSIKTSFNEYILNKPTLLLDKKNINLIYPRFITPLENELISPLEWEKLIYNDSDRRVSYYLDEVQTKDRISLKDNLIAVGLPLRHLLRNYSEEEMKNIYNKVKLVLQEKGIDVPIINSSEYDFADDEECIKKYSLNIK